MGSGARFNFLSIETPDCAGCLSAISGGGKDRSYRDEHMRRHAKLQGKLAWLCHHPKSMNPDPLICGCTTLHQDQHASANNPPLQRDIQKSMATQLGRSESNPTGGV